jgi:hypothetical protein
MNDAASALERYRDMPFIVKQKCQSCISKQSSGIW